MKRWTVRSKQERLIIVCGTYKAECAASHGKGKKLPICLHVANALSVEIIGEKKADLSQFVLTDSHYLKKECTEDDFEMAVRYNYEIPESNDEGKKYEMVTKDVSVVCSESYLSHVKCADPMKPMVPYSTKDLNCTDEGGVNPFEQYKKMIGITTNVTATFTASNVTLTTKTFSSVLSRVSEEGCSAAPTSSPTKAPHSLIPLWIMTGLAVAAMIISFIICCCRKGAQSETETLV